MALRRLALLFPPAALLVILLGQVTGFGSWIAPNTTIEAGSQNILFNLSIDNTNSTLNITQVNVTLPPGFSFTNNSNQTSSNLTHFQAGSFLVWSNQTPPGIIQNLTEIWFVFNSSVNTTPGTYNLTVTVLYTDDSTNSSILFLTLNDTTPPTNLTFPNPTPSNNSWTNTSWFMVNLTFDELNPNTCLLDLNNGTTQNMTMSRNGTTCWLNVSNQLQGNLNWSVWMNDTSGNLAWNGTWYLSIGPVPHDLSPGSGTPPNGSVTNRDWVFLNFTFTEANPNTCLLYFDNGTMYALNMTLNSTHGFCHINITSQEECHINYTFWMNNTLGAPNSTGPFFVTVDLTPTIITNRTVVAGYTAANISWITGFPADSRVFYGPESPGNLTMNQTDLSLTTNHSINLSNLTMGVTYLYNITSCDNLSLCNTSGTWNFTALCIENWTYGSWGTCNNDIQSRSATDLNSCGTTDNRSAVVQSCDDGGGSSGGSGGSDLQPTVTRAFSSITPSNPAVLTIASSGITATRIKIEVSEIVSTSNLVVKGYSSKPFSVPAPPMNVYSYMNITTTINMTRVSRVTIEFSVERSWAERNSIPESTIMLMRYNDSHGSWSGIPTRLISSDNDTINFRSTTIGFSWFAVAGQPSGNITGEFPEQNDSALPQDGSGAGQLPEVPSGNQSQGALCVPGEMSCLSGILLQSCNEWGTGWINEERCFYGCRDGACSSSLVIEIDYISLWVGIAAIVILLTLAIIYIKRRAIDDFLFWRF